MRTPKIDKFNELIDCINQKENLSINKYSEKSDDLSSDGWLAGFIDADGSFDILNEKKEVDSAGKTVKKRRIACRFRIEQRMFDPVTNKSYGPALQKIADFLEVKLNTSLKKRTGNEYYSIEAKGIKSIAILINYLNTYPLFGSKYLDFCDWEKVANLIISQTHYEEKNSVLVDELKNGMNNRRENFDWTHLKKIFIANDPTHAVLSCAFWNYLLLGKRVSAPGEGAPITIRGEGEVYFSNIVDNMFPCVCINGL